MQLGAFASAQGFRLEWHDEVASTNTLAMDRLRAGAGGWLWICAARQTAGRGRLGRPWQSATGNLFASVGLIDPSPMRHAPQLSFVMSLALVDALDALTHAALPLAIKWPNDVLCEGRKLAGILIEGSSLPSGGFACVAGIGVNCLATPQLTAYPATSLLQEGFQLTPRDVLPALADAFARRLQIWNCGHGFAAIRQAWLARAAGLGAEIETIQGHNRARGLFAGLDAEGHLLLDTGAGLKTIEAADITLPGSNVQGAGPEEL